MSQADTPYQFGIEEELFLADATTRGTPAPEAARAFHEAVARTLENAGRENLHNQVEIQVGPTADPAAAREGLAAARTTLASLARVEGLLVFASGTHPNACWPDQDQSEGDRYDRMIAEYGILASRNMVCALHVHVALPDLSRRADLMRRMVPFLPTFLALSASSPFWECRNTGLAAYRMAAYREWPRSGLPDLMANEADYARYLSVMTRSGAIPDESYLWWAIRPSGKFPTLELRVCDSCARLDDAIAIATLYRCVVRMFDRRPDIHATLTGASRAIAGENFWRVQRHGVHATLIDEASAEMRPFADGLDALLTLVEEDADALACAPALDELRALVRRGTGADRQIETWENARDVGQDEPAARAAIVDMLVRTTSDPTA